MLSEGHAVYSPQVNIRSSEDFHLGLTDVSSACSHDVNMAAPETPLWYLQEWFAVAGKKQRDLVTGLDWLPAKANKVWHGVQEPKSSEIHEIAAFINIDAHELLMPPEEAMKLRRLKSVLNEVAAPAPVQVPDAVAEPGAKPTRRKAG